MLDATEDSATGSPRRRARVLALKSLFEGDLVGHDPLEVVGRLVDDEPGEVAVVAYARHLVEGVLRERPEIDREITRAAPAWPIEQMPAVDKNLLRLAIYELLHDNSQVPARAAINEAVEIAKGFGSESSSRFVNGVLGTVVAGQESRASSNRGSDSTGTCPIVPPVADP
jgi:N utilization substance protein B